MAEIFNLENDSDFVRLELFIRNFGEKIDGQLAATVARVLDNYYDALKENVPVKTGNMKDAIFKTYSFKNSSGRFIPTSDVGNYKDVDFRAYAGFFSKKDPVDGHDVLDYVFAQDEGSEVVGKPMTMRIPEGQVYPRAKKVRDSSGNYIGVATDHREIFGKHFIEQSQIEALSKVDIEVAKFMRADLIAR